MTTCNKWLSKNKPHYQWPSILAAEDGWNAACETILRTIKRRHKEFEGNWQHEDIEILIQEIKGMTKLKK